MGRLLRFLLAMLLPISVSATTWTCPTGAWSELDSNITSRVVNGDIVQLPATTNHYLTTITNAVPPKYFTIQGAGTPVVVVPGATAAPVTNAVGVGAATSTCIIYDSSTGSAFDITTASNQAGGVRITGILFMRGTNTPSDQTVGITTMRGTGHMNRVDHCHFWKVGQSDIYFKGWALGCIDHNIFWDDGNNLSVTVDADTWGDHDNGHGSWAADNTLGSTNAVYIEWNIATNQYSTSGILDGDFGGRAVVRYNTMTNLPPVTTHGSDTGIRSFRQLEYYGNFSSWDTNEAGGFGGSKFTWDRHLYSRGGTVLCFSNASLGFRHLTVLAAYREFMGGWTGPGGNLWFRGASGTNVWDTNAGTIFDSGTHNGVTGTMLIDSTKTWIANQWATGYVALNLSRGTYGVFGTNGATNGVFPFANGAQQGVGGGWGETNILWASGDSYQIVYLDHAIDQAGLGKGDLLTGNNPILNVTAGNIPAWPHEIVEKCYEWSNSMGYYPLQQSWIGGPVVNLFAVQMPTIVSNRDYVDGVPMPGYTPLAQNPLDVTSDPVITTQPQNQAVQVGQTALFFFIASSGSPPLAYQWTKNGMSIAGATQTFYQTPPTVIGDNGSLFAATVTNSTNSTATTASALLTVTNAPTPAIIINTANIGTARVGSAAMSQ